MSSDRPSTTRSGLHRVAVEARRRSSSELRAYSVPTGPRSGTMPDASGRVICPFCRKLYPFSAALLDRNLRCSGCRAVFTTAADRRTFKVSPPPEPVPDAVGTASHAARTSLAKASDDLSSLAKQALDALSDKEKPHPRPGSGSVPDIQSLTARISRKRPSGPILTGSGESEHRWGRTLAAWVAGGVLAAGLVLLLAGHEDGRWVALREFQSAPGVSSDQMDRIHALMRRAWTMVAVDPIVGLESATLRSEQEHRLDQALAPLSGMVPLARGRLWVPADRVGEASSLIKDTALETPVGERAAIARLGDAGIRAVTWGDMQAEIDRRAPPGLESLGTILLSARPVRGDRPDPVVLLAEGRMPASAVVSPFDGHGRLLLREGGFREVPYRGRLVRFIGDGWPEDWAILDLGVVPAAEGAQP